MKSKILFINGHLNYGGVEKSLVDILNNIDYKKYSVDLLLLEGMGDYFSFIPKEVNVILFDLHNTYGNLFSVIRKCLKKCDFLSIWIKFVFLLSDFLGIKVISLLKPFILKNSNYDAVIGFRPGVSSDFAAWLFNANKRILWWHNGEINMNSNQKKNYIDDCVSIDLIVSVSNGCRNMLISELNINEKKIVVIPNMIDSHKIVKMAHDYIPIELSENKLKIVSVGRLSEEKHFDNCIRAASLLKSCGISFIWIIVGEGTERAHLENLIKKFGVQECISLVGKKKNPYPYMFNADIYVHSSYIESQSLTILESMTLGIPCVIADSLGPSEYCKNGYNCIYVEHGGHALFEGIKRMLELYNANSLTAMKNNAKNTALQFSNRQVMKQIYTLLNR